MIGHRIGDAVGLYPNAPKTIAIVVETRLYTDTVTHLQEPVDYFLAGQTGLRRSPPGSSALMKSIFGEK